ncbi:reducing type I polyketide synthase [Aspergillus minisclerotigenes]|uniref:Reducing type I polyketide synthase n=1 Tax=Aspergillus minisclerotigenes TaxID=656917 RepID=A0A5N6IUP0_9EURO|nr:reducing type I polyketide synthase [Aspergillus minisclerotigenes]
MAPLRLAMGLSLEQDNLAPIAVIGLSLQLPGGVTDLDNYWELMMESRCVCQDFPPDRINSEGMPVKKGHFLSDNVAAFDASFFSVSGAEAASMDPQQRLLLETTYRAFENAGITMSQVHGSNTSVYIGCFTDDYKTLYEKDLTDNAAYAATGITTTLNANRLSWFFNLLGPSVNVDTACSSSLVALDLACQSIWSGTSDMSVVGGVNLLLAPDLFHTLWGMNMLSPEGRCRSFDARGNGYGRGEGAGVIIIKRLETAITDGDTIRAVIRSTASNQDGHTLGLTQPSQSSQEQLIDHCYSKAGLERSRTGYVEAHGTGTPVGDPIEARALGAAFREGRSPGNPLYVGSVKSNIGHLEGASGIAGVIKAIAMLERGIIPAIADLDRVNPQIDEEHLRIRFPRRTTAWPKKGLRRISVNSFGFGGSNAHVIIDDAYHFLIEHGLQGITRGSVIEPLPLRLPGPLSQECHSYDHTSGHDMPVILPISAASKSAVSRTALLYSEYFEKRLAGHHASKELLNMFAGTLTQRRSNLSWRAFTVIDSTDKLKDFKSHLSAPYKANPKPIVAFVFTGQGAQWLGMGRELFQYRVFRHSLQQAEVYLQSVGCTWKLSEELYEKATRSRINEPQISQALCTAIQVALVDLLAYFDVRPDAVIGHSSGEIAAAYCCGAISKESAWKIAYIRGVQVSALYENKSLHGAMMAVGLPPEHASRLLDEDKQEFRSLSIACYNSPSNVTISGDENMIDSLKLKLDKLGTFARKLKTNAAYHSSHMNAIAMDYISSIGPISAGESRLRGPTMVSTVSGQRVMPETLQQPSYWMNNMVSPVKFYQAFERLCANRVVKKIDGSHRGMKKIDVCLEIGPHSALRGPIMEIIASKGSQVAYLSALQRGLLATRTLLETVGHLWCLGCCPNLAGVNKSPGRTASICDLPQYPFDHSQTYFHESRIARAHRLQRRSSYHLLGERVTDWNPLEPRWRNFLSLLELPWIQDHKINDMALFPAAGMMSMAIEAALDTATPLLEIRGIELRDVIFYTALVIPDNGRGVEIQFFVHSHGKHGKTGGKSWSTFRLCAYMNDRWEDICFGCLRVDYEMENPGIDDGHSIQSQIGITQQRHTALSNNSQSVHVDDFYALLQNCGINYGVPFRNLKKARFARGESVGEVSKYLWSSENEDLVQKYTVAHPCTLDAFFHLPLVNYTQGGKSKRPTMIPSRIRRVWISSSGIDWSTEEPLKIMSHIVSQDSRSTECEVTTLRGDLSTIIAQLEGINMTVVDKVSEESDTPAEELHFWNPIWLPDIDTMQLEEIFKYCEDGILDDAEPTEFYSRLSSLHKNCLRQVLQAIPDARASKHSSHLLKYLQWARSRSQDKICRGTAVSEPCPANGNAYADENASWLDGINAQGKVHALVARHLQAILLSELDPLELLFSNSLLDNYYAELTDTTKSFKLLKKYLQLYSHKYPNAEYLEIGAGTGGSTVSVLNSLVQERQGRSTCSMYKNYTYTDISEAFFTSAKKKFHGFSNLTFKRLDIEKPAISQGFVSESYDVIIAANALHATTDLNATLKNVAEMLRPGGKLILFEITNPAQGRTAFVMGLLPGWWCSSESFRSQGPCIETADWHKLLQQNGFSGVEQEFRDYQSAECHELSILITTKIQQPEAAIDALRADVILHSMSVEHMTFSTSLHQRIVKENCVESRLISFHDISTASDHLGSVAIIPDSPSQSYLDGMDSQGLLQLQRILQSYKSIVWVSCTAGNGSAHPKHGMTSGLVRSWNTEMEVTKSIRVGLEPCGSVSSKQIRLILTAISHMMRSSAEACELEYEERQGLLHICRLKSDDQCYEAFVGSASDMTPCTLPWKDAPPLRLVTETPGLLDSLHFIEDTTTDIPLLDDEIEIEVRAMGVNFKDGLIALGRVPGDKLGNECAGIVRKVGSACQLKFQPGDKVCMSTTEAFKKYARSKVQCVCHLPPTMSFVEAASIPTQFVTAWTCIHDIARLKKGEAVLIHAGAGGTGQAGIQISLYLGAQVYATVGSKRKKDFLMSHYGIPANHIFYSRDTSFAAGIKSCTGGRGVDVVLNSLAGDSLQASWECLAPYGRFVEIGKTDILANSALPMLPFNRGVTFSAFDGSIWMVERPLEAQRNIEIIMGLFAKNKLKITKPLTVHNIANIDKAFSDLVEGKSIGKAVVEISPAAIVPNAIIRKKKYTFLRNATYLIAGGFGGLGRIIARWMVDKGARNLIILSRSGLQSPTSSSLVEELRGMGATIQAPKCDISNDNKLRNALEECSRGLPPIRGCIQASMVLKDVLFDQMQLSDWESVTAPKVSGSWNLHALLPKDLDFFVLLSSVSGIIGHRGQSNYVAGNTYQDALAHYRVSRGQKAVSINLGAMVDDGYLVENKDKNLKARLLETGAMQPVTRGTFLTLLETYCNPSLGVLALANCQVACGINTPQGRGVDEPSWLQRPLFSALHAIRSQSARYSIGEAVGPGNEKARDFRQEFIDAPTLPEASLIATEALISKLSRNRSLTGSADIEIDIHTPIASYGVDSLLAVDIRSWFRKVFQANVPTYEILNGTSFASLGTMVANRSGLKRRQNQSMPVNP